MDPSKFHDEIENRIKGTTAVVPKMSFQDVVGKYQTAKKYFGKWLAF